MARLSKIEEENVKLTSENKKLTRDNSDLRKEMDELNVNVKDEFDHFTQEIKSLSKTVQKLRFKNFPTFSTEFFICLSKKSKNWIKME